MSDEAFVRLSRRFFENFLWTERRQYSRAEAWLDLVQSSAYEPQKRMIAGELVEVPRGGIVASERFLSDRWTWSRTKVRAFLDLLLSQHMVRKVEKDHQNTAFLLCNFEKYNPQKNQRKTSEEPPGDLIEEDEEGKKLISLSKGRAASEQEVVDFCSSIEVANGDAQYLWHTWESSGWTRAGKQIKDWKMAVRAWKSGGFLPSQRNGHSKPKRTEQQRDKENTGLEYNQPIKVL